MGRTRRDFLKTSAIGAGAAAGLFNFPMVSRARAKKLTVWWDRHANDGTGDATLARSDLGRLRAPHPALSPEGRGRG
jgi:anaerobic selenocysteine-containing dehydrogenase